MRSGAKKLTAKRRELYLQALREGKRRGAAAREIGMTRQALWWVRQNDAEFGAAAEEAELEANEVIEDALYQAAQAGNVVAVQVWLYNRMPDRWRDQRNLRVGGDDSAPPVRVALDLKRLSDEELGALERLVGIATGADRDP